MIWEYMNRNGGLFCLWITEINGQSWKEKQQFF